MSPEAPQSPDDLYDKLSQVSVSHRRVDSFEWVMTQSAPNTPQTMPDSRDGSFSPLPTRRIGSAPLPVPNEMWSSNPRPRAGAPRRGYFDWWPSPNLGFSQEGYTRVSTSENEEELDRTEHVADSRRSIAGPSRPFVAEQTQAPATLSNSNSPPLPSQELNALGIILPPTPPSTPPTSSSSKASPSSHPIECSPQVTSRLPKKVTFSPIIDKVELESFPEFESIRQSPSLWGSYLPSSFLIARPAINRTVSSPVPTLPKKLVAPRPILKRPSPQMYQLDDDFTPSTEMIRMSSEASLKGARQAASPIPSRRPSVVQPRTDGIRQLDGNSGQTDSAFAAILQATQKPRRTRCDSLLSNSSGIIS
ncbi:hypothetical protein E8E13_000548 [Curvularia kusanoi]|uniref:Uncharacterized protein n=1 Tax=Curvularia kusanoi TaxID=90978 RepID=A0A9P4T382_CURKU|nr:hypothetical protein E8E13_000548 [Curvularia kusanoi]